MQDSKSGLCAQNDEDGSTNGAFADVAIEIVVPSTGRTIKVHTPRYMAVYEHVEGNLEEFRRRATSTGVPEADVFSIVLQCLEVRGHSQSAANSTAIKFSIMSR